jgi:hypothetical protein
MRKGLQHVRVILDVGTASFGVSRSLLEKRTAEQRQRVIVDASRQRVAQLQCEASTEPT